MPKRRDTRLSVHEVKALVDTSQAKKEADSEVNIGPALFNEMDNFEAQNFISQIQRRWLAAVTANSTTDLH